MADIQYNFIGLTPEQGAAVLSYLRNAPLFHDLENDLAKAYRQVDVIVGQYTTPYTTPIEGERRIAVELFSQEPGSTASVRINTQGVLGVPGYVFPLEIVIAHSLAHGSGTHTGRYGLTMANADEPFVVDRINKITDQLNAKFHTNIPSNLVPNQASLGLTDLSIPPGLSVPPSIKAVRFQQSGTALGPGTNFQNTPYDQSRLPPISPEQHF